MRYPSKHSESLKERYIRLLEVIDYQSTPGNIPGIQAWMAIPNKRLIVYEFIRDDYAGAWPFGRFHRRFREGFCHYILVQFGFLWNYEGKIMDLFPELVKRRTTNPDALSGMFMFNNWAERKRALDESILDLLVILNR